MDPLLDEKIVLTLLRTVPDYLLDSLMVHAMKEAYGPSRNKGLCHESVSAIGFRGDIAGTMYFCMDGYTKLKLLPRIAERFQVDPGIKGMADSVLLEFSNQMAADIINELRDGGFETQLEPPENLSHELVPVDLEKSRQYILVFFLRERRERSYLGRLYVVLTVAKY